MSKRWHEHLRTAAVLFGLLFAATGTAPEAIAADHASPIVRTTEGPVQGFVRNGVDQFLGIPYAAPPIGDLRWQPPKPHAAWTQTLNATRFGNTCPQITELGVFAGPVSLTEDCLYLNVFTMRTKPRARVQRNYRCCSGSMAADCLTARATTMMQVRWSRVGRQGRRWSSRSTIALACSAI